jgi:hypothetical protein
MVEADERMRADIKTSQVLIDHQATADHQSKRRASLASPSIETCEVSPVQKQAVSTDLLAA